MDLDRLPDLALARDVGPASWLVESLWPWGDEPARVGCFVPAAYAAHMRLLHPAGREERTRWADLARERGVEIGPSTGFLEVSGRDPDDADDGPRDGTLPAAELEALRTLLAPFTGTPGRCWFAYWVGWGIWGGNVSFDLPPGASREELARRARAAEARAAPQRAYLDAIPRLRLPHREYYLFHGALAAPLPSLYLGSPFDVGPNIWWPDDRAWCVATEIDGYDTYVACSDAAAEAVLASRLLETLRVRPEDALPGW